jgi:hypothetical protein
MGDGTFWGADSANPLNDTSYCGGSGCSGKTFVNYVINGSHLSSSPHDTIRFWGRYFRNAYSSSVMWQGDGESEAFQAAQQDNSSLSNKSAWILPISCPNQSIMHTGTAIDGQNAANETIAYLISHLSSVLRMPGNNTLFVYLDWEDLYSLNSNYAEGFANAVNDYIYDGGVPFFAALYLAATNTDGQTACATANSSGGV